MFGHKIGVIYLYLVSVIALVLLIIGIFNWGTLTLNLTQYDKYPLQYAENCDVYPAKSYDGPSNINVLPATPSASEIENQKKVCQDRLELERKHRKLDDIKNAVLFTLIGGILFAIHFPQARKQSKLK